MVHFDAVGSYLTTGNTTGADTGGVLTGGCLLDCGGKNLKSATGGERRMAEVGDKLEERIEVGDRQHLNGVLVGEQVDDVEGVLNNADGHELRQV